ncbi:hypothetical protein NYE69_28440 [Paenibacillus sp. FSL R5-0527]|uniref:hypothetical protein n=1 Tax=Paenibacillus sp. FSL R5-0527 TaxID=2975321 RepID=UPI000979E30C|nr:hypothetical protein BK140_10960 [Paenibacillus macerans]
MDEAIKNGVHDWLDSLKAELGMLLNQCTEKKIELEVLKLRKEVAEEAVDKIEDGFLREKFYNKYVNEVDEEIKKCSSELEMLRKSRKELNISVAALEKTIQSSSFRKAP